MIDGHEHIFTLLNTEKDQKKGVDAQLINTKHKIKYLYESSFVT